MASFIKMANQYDICCVSAKSNQTCKKEVVDVYKNGFQTMQIDTRKGSKIMNCMQPATTLYDEEIDDTEEIHSDEEDVHIYEDEEEDV